MPSRRRFISLALGSIAALTVRELAVRAESDPATVYLPLVVRPSTDDAPIIGSASGTVTQAVDWLATRAVGYTAYDVHSIVESYATHGETVGVDWFLALAQCAHETGSLSSWWCQRPRRNPAGIGVTGKLLSGVPELPPGSGWAWDGVQWREGLSFASWADESVPAHLGRLLAYALPEGTGTPEQQSMIDYALDWRALPAQYRGVAATISGLDGRWAYPGVGYGARIVDRARRMREA
jgi:hypothetical protein